MYKKFLLYFLLVINLSAFDGYQKWIAIAANLNYTKQVIEQKLFWEDFYKLYLKNLQSGLPLTNIDYMDGKWVGVFSKDKNIKQEALITKRRLRYIIASTIKFNKHGFVLIDLKYGLGKWVALFAKYKNNPYKKQSIYSAKNWDNLVFYIKQEWEKGNRIIDLERGEAKWVALFSKRDDITKQEIYVRDEWKKLYKTIINNLRDDYKITKIIYGKGDWFAILSKTKKYQNQHLIEATSFEKLQQEAKKLYQKNIYLMDISYGF